MDLLLIAMMFLALVGSVFSFIMAGRVIMKWEMHRKFGRCNDCGQSLCPACHKGCRQGQRLL